jgi:quercetin dioxygenase-like cupin family protein
MNIGRRVFAGCALCALTSGTLTAGAAAQSAPPGITRKTLNTVEMPGGKIVCIQMVTDVEPGVTFPRHTHPGIETTYVVEGELTLSVQGQPDRVLKAGEGFEVPAGVIHGGKNGTTKARMAQTFTVEKDKPLTTLAPA